MSEKITLKKCPLTWEMSDVLGLRNAGWEMEENMQAEACVSVFRWEWDQAPHIPELKES